MPSSPSPGLTFATFAVLFATMSVGSQWGCAGDPPTGLLPTRSTGGPRVVFDLDARPLPDMPFPNDMATRIDPSSPTGRRINASLIAPTQLEGDVRSEFAAMDGFGTQAALTVKFDADVDPVAIREAHRNDRADDDVAFLVDLKTGETAPLDLGRGNYPATLENTSQFFPNDPRSRSSTIAFETEAEDLDGDGRLDVEEDGNGNGALDAGEDRDGDGHLDTREDTDGDGHLDVPNTLDPSKPLLGRDDAAERAPPGQGGNHIYRDLMVHYERQSHTLILRPVVPLRPRTTYAVVLTDRIRGVTGEGLSIQSPFESVHHAAQTESLRPLLPIVDSGRVPGLTRDRIAFAWTFTTQSTTDDLVALREGLHGRGPFGWMERKFPARLEPSPWIDSAQDEVRFDHPVFPMLQAGPATVPTGGNRYVLPAQKLINFMLTFGSSLGLNPADSGTKRLLKSFEDVDYFVFGSFSSPDLLDDPSKPTNDAVWRINAQTGKAQVWERPADWQDREREYLEAEIEGRDFGLIARLQQRARFATRDRITFMLAVPKSRGGLRPPFKTAIFGHGAGSTREEALSVAGYMAHYGIATLAINSYAHGLDMPVEFKAAVRGSAEAAGLASVAKMFFQGRSRDLTGDGVADSGGDFWCADLFHVRDVVRQSVLDWMQLIRVVRGFGTYEMGDLDGDGKSELAGDFNADGVVDVGGTGPDGRPLPGSDIHLTGASLGGILSAVGGAVEADISTVIPIAGGAGLGDVAQRTVLGGVVNNVFLDTMGPIVVSEPVEGGVDLYLVLNSAGSQERIKINTAPVTLNPGDTVELHSTPSRGRDADARHDAAVVDSERRIRLQVAADGPSFADDAPFGVKVRVGGCDDPAALAETAAELHVLATADCLRLEVHRPVGGRMETVQVIDRFGQDSSFRGRIFPAGTPLVSPWRGLGLKRGTPELRRFLGLAQTILEPADPGNYAVRYADPLPSREGKPVSVLLIPTNGDLGVPVATGFSLARAAGVLPHRYDASRDQAWGMSPNDVVIRSGAMEGLEKLKYFKPVADAMRDVTARLEGDDADRAKLFTCEEWTRDDQGGLAAEPTPRPEWCEGAALPDLTNYAWDPASKSFLDSANGYMQGQRGKGVPRLRAPLTPALEHRFAGHKLDGTPAEQIRAMVLPYPDADGRHGFDFPDPAQNFDIGSFMLNMAANFIRTEGTSLRYDLCMHRDGLKTPPAEGAEAIFDPQCEFLRVP